MSAGGSPALRAGFLAMGTWVTVTVAVDAARRAAAEEAVSAVRSLIEGFGRDWWAWGEGALAAINRHLAAGAAAEIPAGMHDLFARAWELRQLSGGRFEPRIAALVRLWGFDDPAHLRSLPPPTAEIAQLLSALHPAPPYDGGPSYGPAPGVGWDFGGIGKGYIVDQALDLLRERGFADALLDAGGNLAVRGANGARPWRVGIRDPRAADGGVLLAALSARDEAVNTHGDDQRYFEYQGQRYAHLLDPATGVPVRGLRALTVVHRDATLAEAGGAALYVATPAERLGLARRLGIDSYLLVGEDGVVRASPALLPRLEPEPGVRIEPLF